MILINFFGGVNGVKIQSRVEDENGCVSHDEMYIDIKSAKFLEATLQKAIEATQKQNPVTPCQKNWRWMVCM